MASIEVDKENRSSVSLFDECQKYAVRISFDKPLPKDLAEAIRAERFWLVEANGRAVYRRNNQGVDGFTKLMAAANRLIESLAPYGY